MHICVSMAHEIPLAGYSHASGFGSGNMLHKLASVHSNTFSDVTRPQEKGQHRQQPMRLNVSA